MAPLDHVRMLSFHDEEVGMGFNSHSGEAIGTPFTFDRPSSNPDVPGQGTTESIDIITTHEALMKTLHTSFEAQGRYGFFSASGKAEFVQSIGYNSTSSY